MSGYGGTTYLGITMEASHIFYGLILLLQGIYLLNDKLVALKRVNSEPILIVKRNKRRRLIDYFGLDGQK